MVSDFPAECLPGMGASSGDSGHHNGQTFSIAPGSLGVGSHAQGFSASRDVQVLGTTVNNDHSGSGSHSSGDGGCSIC